MTINHVVPKAPPEAGVVFEVFGNKLLGVETRVQNLSAMIGSYLNADEQAVIQAYNRFYNCPLPVQFKMHEESSYRALLDEPFRGSKRHESVLKALFARALCSGPFQAEIRRVETGNFGFVFPMEPDAMAYAMQNVKGKTVVELAGASGILSIVLALAGAEKVLMNEINGKEIENFRRFYSQCPPDLQRRVTCFHANCLELPKVCSQAQFVLCRNLIHFFNDAQMQMFFKMLHEMMKPGAEAIFVANSAYPYKREEIEQHPGVSCFNITKCNLYDDPKSNDAAEFIFKRVVPCSGTKIGPNPTCYNIYTRDAQGKWQPHKDVFSRLHKTIQPAIREAVKAHKAKMQKMQEVVVEVSYVRLFTLRTLANLFEQNGFVVNGTFISDIEGNRVTHDFYNSGQRVGVVVTKKGA